MLNLYTGEIEFNQDKLAKKISFGQDGEIPDFITSIHHPLSADAEMSMECEINPVALSKILGVDLANNDDATSITMEFDSSYLVQVRRHKKKRINKKWAKRYGFVTKFKHVKITDITTKADHNGYGISFNSNHLKIGE